MGRESKGSSAVQDSAVRLVSEQTTEYLSQKATVASVAVKIGSREETLRRWVMRAEANQRGGAGLASDERELLKQLEERKRANEILRTVSVFCAIGVRPLQEMMLGFIDQKSGTQGVVPICENLPIAPSTCNADKAGQADPAALSARSRTDADLKTHVLRVWDA